MYIAEIELTDVRAIRHLRLDFRNGGGASELHSSRRWTVLLGENGCGKSTILKAIALVLAGSDALPDLIDDPDDWIRRGSELAKIRAVVVSSTGEDYVIELLIRQGDGRDSIIRRNAKRLSALDRVLNRNPTNYFIAGYGAFRRPRGASHFQSGDKLGFNQKRSRASAIATLFSPTAELVSFEQWAMRLDYTKSRSGRDLVAQTLSIMLPSMTFSHIDRERGQVFMKTVDGLISLNQLSEGYQAMAAWAGDLLFRISESSRAEDPRQARGLLLIDEMDLHLHPVWQRRLVEFLNNAFPNLQIIATTHSPLSVQQCNEGELFVVRRNEQAGPQLISFEGDPKNMRLSDLFLSPLIGLDTLDSPSVAGLRRQAREIELKPGVPSGEDRAQLRAIIDKLKVASPISKAELRGYDAYAPAVAELRTRDPLAVIERNEIVFRASAQPAAAASRVVKKGRKSAKIVRRKPAANVSKSSKTSKKRSTVAEKSVRGTKSKPKLSGLTVKIKKKATKSTPTIAAKKRVKRS